ncbi:hypothetical protein CC80DRAFT_548281 [Byssothecium circinans]|uniref:Uncharacterized protein n=1 Tax=Byssothecium circinans TaxID=147558 RepID=A0A6A5TWH0_9PLEO|nr:hypothetical protein CC80DRAFT_548281 [Byssothecium circinans]
MAFWASRLSAATKSCHQGYKQSAMAPQEPDVMKLDRAVGSVQVGRSEELTLEGQAVRAGAAIRMKQAATHLLRASAIRLSPLAMPGLVQFHTLTVAPPLGASPSLIRPCAPARRLNCPRTR